MKKVLVTGGTVFVSKYVAQYFAAKDYEVYVLNRGNRPQPENTTLIKCDRNNLGNILKDYNFDAILDINSYSKSDVEKIIKSAGHVNQYIFLSSSAVYPETEPQPFKEDTKLGRNVFWRDYGINKIEAEEYLLSKKPDAYIVRPPYLYGPMNNVYREAFVFDCAMQHRKFYMPKDGSLQLQFFYIEDLCRIFEAILEKNPENHIYNVGNEETVSVFDWVKLCYDIAGEKLETVSINDDIEQRNYFSFYNYDYKLDVECQKEILSETTDFRTGLKKAFEWYKQNPDQVVKKNYISFIQDNFEK